MLQNKTNIFFFFKKKTGEWTRAFRIHFPFTQNCRRTAMFYATIVTNPLALTLSSSSKGTKLTLNRSKMTTLNKFKCLSNSCMTPHTLVCRGSFYHRAVVYYQYRSTQSNFRPTYFFIGLAIVNMEPKLHEISEKMAKQVKTMLKLSIGVIADVCEIISRLVTLVLELSISKNKVVFSNSDICLLLLITLIPNFTTETLLIGGHFVKELLFGLIFENLIITQKRNILTALCETTVGLGQSGNISLADIRNARAQTKTYLYAMLQAGHKAGCTFSQAFAWD